MISFIYFVGDMFTEIHCLIDYHSQIVFTGNSFLISVASCPVPIVYDTALGYITRYPFWISNIAICPYCLTKKSLILSYKLPPIQ